MKSSMVVLLSLFLNVNQAKAFCKAEGLQRDIEVIVSRADLTIDERRKDIAHAKNAFKEDTIECAMSGELISEKAATLAIKYINEDSTTKPGQATDALIERIQNQIPKN